MGAYGKAKINAGLVYPFPPGLENILRTSGTVVLS